MTDKQVKEQIKAIHETTEKLLSQGSEVCRQFLINAGIVSTPLDASVQPEPDNDCVERIIEAYGLKTRSWGLSKKYGYACGECCNGDRCDEDCKAKYRGDRKNCPHCKGKGWIPPSETVYPEHTTKSDQLAKAWPEYFSVGIDVIELAKETIQNALYATGKLKTDDCEEVCDGILLYLQDAGLIITKQQTP